MSASAEQSPLTVAIIGAGPSGIYAAEALSQQSEVAVQIAVIDMLPVPFGLVRYGVAPDHPSIRSIRHTLQRTLEKSGVRFFGDVTIGRDLSIAELRETVDAVIYAYGAGSAKPLRIPGEDLFGSMAAPEFVAWYCGHPDVHLDLDPDLVRQPALAEVLLTEASQAVVVGAGNVALDVVRVLIKSSSELADTDMADEVLDSLTGKRVSDVHLLMRRGPAYTAFTTKELRELGQIEDLDIIVDAATLDLDPSSQAVADLDKITARNLVVLREWATRAPTGASRRLYLHFWTKPTRILGEGEGDQARVRGVETERTAIVADGSVSGTGEMNAVPAQLVVRSVGYHGVAMPGVPFDESTGRVPHADGRVIRDGGFSVDEYATGWIKRGPTGVIGTNKSDAVETVTSMLADIAAGALVAHGRVGALDRLLAERGIHPLDMPAWHRIDAAEIERGLSHGRLRTTLAHRSDLLAAAGDDHP